MTDPGGRIQNIGSNGGRRELRDEDGGGKTRCKCKLTSLSDRSGDGRDDPPLSGGGTDGVTGSPPPIYEIPGRPSRRRPPSEHQSDIQLEMRSLTAGTNLPEREEGPPQSFCSLSLSLERIATNHSRWESVNSTQNDLEIAVTSLSEVSLVAEPHGN